MSGVGSRVSVPSGWRSSFQSPTLWILPTRCSSAPSQSTWSIIGHQTSPSTGTPSSRRRRIWSMFVSSQISRLIAWPSMLVSVSISGMPYRCQYALPMP